MAEYDNPGSLRLVSDDIFGRVLEEQMHCSISTVNREEIGVRKGLWKAGNASRKSGGGELITEFEKRGKSLTGDAREGKGNFLREGDQKVDKRKGTKR